MSILDSSRSETVTTEIIRSEASLLWEISNCRFRLFFFDGMAPVSPFLSNRTSSFRATAWRLCRCGAFRNDEGHTCPVYWPRIVHHTIDEVFLTLFAVLRCIQSGCPRKPIHKCGGPSTKLTVSEDKSTVSEDKSTVSEDKSTVSEDKSTVSEDKSTVSEDESTVSEDEIHVLRSVTDLHRIRDVSH
eukprot:1183121-Prorocentrum_minimum.AAC.3